MAYAGADIYSKGNSCSGISSLVAEYLELATITSLVEKIKGNTLLHPCKKQLSCGCLMDFGDDNHDILPYAISCIVYDDHRAVR